MTTPLQPPHPRRPAKLAPAKPATHTEPGKPHDARAQAAQRSWAEWQSILARQAHGDHVYLSTACYHDRHSYCQSEVNGAGQRKTPGMCKFCPARCICTCHQENNPGITVKKE